DRGPPRLREPDGAVLCRLLHLLPARPSRAAPLLDRQHPGRPLARAASRDRANQIGTRVLERLVIAGVLVALLLVAIAAGRRWYAWRNARIEERLRASTASGSG